MSHVFRKEFLRAVFFGTFALCLVGSVVLFVLCVFFFVTEHGQALRSARAQVRPSTTRVNVSRPLSPLGVCVYDAVASATVRPGYAPGVWISNAERNFTLPSRVRLDWAFVIVVVFGVTGIVLSYAAINGEKEDGTLGLLLSYSIPRCSVFLGKYLALAVAAVVPLLAGSLIGLLVVQVFAPGGLTWAHAGDVAVFLAFAGAYISLVVLLSLFVSALTHRSAIAALILLAVWAFWTFLIPGISRLLVEKVHPLPSELEMASRTGPMIKGEVWGRIDEIRKRVKAGELTSKEEVLRLSDEAFIQGQEKLSALQSDISRTKDARTTISRNISRLSPAAAFRYGAEALLNLGFTGVMRFSRDVDRYAAIYDDYVISKMGKLVVTSNWSFSTSMRVGKERVDIRSPRAEEYKGEMSDFPVFTPSRPTLAEALSDALPDLAILLGWNAVLFAAGIVAFIRYDAR